MEIKCYHQPNQQRSLEICHTFGHVNDGRNILMIFFCEGKSFVQKHNPQLDKVLKINNKAASKTMGVMMRRIVSRVWSSALVFLHRQISFISGIKTSP
jgi:hypothetical protein